MDRVVEKISLFRRNQPPRVAVKQADTKRFFQHADLPANGGLTEIQAFASMSETSSFGDCVKNPQFVPIKVSVTVLSRYRTIVL